MMPTESLHQPPSRKRTVLRILVSLQVATAAAAVAASSSQSSLVSNQVAFFPRGGDCGIISARSASSSSILLARRKSLPKTSSASSSIQTVGWRRKKATTLQTLDFDDDDEYYDYNPQTMQDDEPTLEELRAQLGPFGIFVSNAIELTVVTLGSYISGGLLGYIGGGVMGVPSTLFGKDMGGISQRFSALHSKAFTSCRSWATLSAAFSGFHNFVRLCRGGLEDNWNAVFGSALTGAFLNRSGGPQAMIQGGATYACFTYMLDKFFASPSRPEQTSKELLYTDVPIDD
mmetsp:Transcript_41121/g.86389  ORF Transcript_41121/g.86389 Transcript_41121/m.86389 type:complete len:288 (-) Transcript_41121:201-1064(-)